LRVGSPNRLSYPPSPFGKVGCYKIGRCRRDRTLMELSSRHVLSVLCLPVPPYTETWCAARDLNPHPFKDQFLRLTCLPFHQQRIYLVGNVGFEPTISSVRGRREQPDFSSSRITFRILSQSSQLQLGPAPHVSAFLRLVCRSKIPWRSSMGFIKLVGKGGFEPPISRVQGEREQPDFPTSRKKTGAKDGNRNRARTLARFSSATKLLSHWSGQRDSNTLH
jgi:hypothetical protein